MTSLVDRLLPEELRQRIPAVAASPTTRPRGGVLRRIPDRNRVAALVFMARTSTPSALLPAKKLGCGLDDFTGARVACSAGRARAHDRE
jgi:putative N-acetylmannosamine-6-phosphate epimerase